jgi:hypothetical protein
LFAMSLTFNTLELKFIVKEGELSCGNTIFSSPEIKIRNLFDTNNDVMPLNPQDFDLLKYAYRATVCEIADFGLTQRVKDAREKLDIRVYEALAILSDYSVTKKDLDNLILEKLSFS